MFDRRPRQVCSDPSGATGAILKGELEDHLLGRLWARASKQHHPHLIGRDRRKGDLVAARGLRPACRRSSLPTNIAITGS